MRKPNLTTLLTAGMVAGTASFAIAQQNTELNVEQPAEDRAVVTIEEQDSQNQSQQSQQDQQSQQSQQSQWSQDRQSQQRQQMGQQGQMGQMSQQGQQQETKTVSGRVVDLQQWLQQQGQAGQQGEMQSQQARGSHPLSPKAIVTDDNKVHVVLGMTSGQQRFSQSSQQGQGMDRPSDRLSLESDRPSEPGAAGEPDLLSDLNTNQSATTGSEYGATAQAELDTESADRTQLSEGYELPADGQSDDAIALDTDAESRPGATSRTPGLDRNTSGRADNMLGGGVAVDTETRLDSETEREIDQIESRLGQADSQLGQSESQLGQSGQSSQQFGQANSQIGSQAGSQSDSQGQVMGFARPAADLQIGQQVEVTGYVFERQGVQGILITEVNPQQ